MSHEGKSKEVADAGSGGGGGEGGEHKDSSVPLLLDTHHSSPRNSSLGVRPPPPSKLSSSAASAAAAHVKSRTTKSTGKDRHSKVNTARGPRDRRVRLSVSTAIQFYDIQDRLGFDQPSKAIEWLLKKAKPAIDELNQLPPPPLPFSIRGHLSSSHDVQAGVTVHNDTETSSHVVAQQASTEQQQHQQHVQAQHRVHNSPEYNHHRYSSSPSLGQEPPELMSSSTRMRAAKRVVKERALSMSPVTEMHESSSTSSHQHGSGIGVNQGAGAGAGVGGYNIGALTFENPITVPRGASSFTQLLQSPFPLQSFTPGHHNMLQSTQLLTSLYPGVFGIPGASNTAPSLSQVFQRGGIGTVQGGGQQQHQQQQEQDFMLVGDVGSSSQGGYSFSDHRSFHHTLQSSGAGNHQQHHWTMSTTCTTTPTTTTHNPPPQQVHSPSYQSSRGGGGGGVHTPGTGIGGYPPFLPSQHHHPHHHHQLNVESGGSEGSGTPFYLVPARIQGMEDETSEQQHHQQQQHHLYHQQQRRRQRGEE